MSLHVPLFTVIPDETVRVAKAAFPKGNRYLQLRDTFGPLFDSADFQHLFSAEGRPAEDLSAGCFNKVAKHGPLRTMELRNKPSSEEEYRVLPGRIIRMDD